MKCNNCGFENKEGTSFCTKCGNSLQIQPDNRKNVTHQTSKNLSKNNTNKNSYCCISYSCNCSIWSIYLSLRIYK